MGKMLNFDNFIQEHEKRTMDVTIFGDVYVVPMEIPAIVPIMMARAEETMDSRENTRMIMRAADALFGVEGVNQMCRKGMSAKRLITIIEKVFAEIMHPEKEDDDEQELSDENSRVQTNKSKRAKK